LIFFVGFSQRKYWPPQQWGSRSYHICYSLDIILIIKYCNIL
jgi:hypothetical protein